MSLRALTVCPHCMGIYVQTTSLLEAKWTLAKHRVPFGSKPPMIRSTQVHTCPTLEATHRSGASAAPGTTRRPRSHHTSSGFQRLPLLRSCPCRRYRYALRHPESEQGEPEYNAEDRARELGGREELRRHQAVHQADRTARGQQSRHEKRPPPLPRRQDERCRRHHDDGYAGPRREPCAQGAAHRDDGQEQSKRGGRQRLGQYEPNMPHICQSSGTGRVSVSMAQLCCVTASLASRVQQSPVGGLNA